MRKVGKMASERDRSVGEQLLDRGSLSMSNEDVPAYVPLPTYQRE